MSKNINETKYLNDTNSRKNNILFHIYISYLQLSSIARKKRFKYFNQCYTEKRDSYGKV